MSRIKNFKPAWWLPGPHLQTIWAALHEEKSNLPFKRERLELSDGDFLDLDWYSSATNAPRVLVLHGLNGSDGAPYIQRILLTIQQQGWCGILLNFRGCSGEPNRLPCGYHAGATNDLQTVIHEIYQRDTKTPLAVVGYSLGGNVLLKWLGETQYNNPLTAAVAISVPFEIHKTAHRLNQGFSRFYQWWLLRGMREFVRSKHKVTPFPVALDQLEELKSILEFDRTITAPLHGFVDAQDYYRKASSRSYLQYIKKPTLIVQAKDDPFMTPDIIPEPHELSSTIQLEVTPNGGHVGFVSGTIPGKPVYWLEGRILEYLKSYLV